MFEFVFNFVKEIISISGYAGIFFFMILESMIFPIPSEAVMPFAGFLVGSQFSWLGVWIASSAGSMCGSILSYFIGRFGGQPFIERFGKFLLLDKHHLAISENFFRKYGEAAIFSSRFIPVIRHFISIPAGAANMNFARFCIYTFVGSSLWNMFLALLGFIFRKEYVHIIHKIHYLDYLVVIILFALIVKFFIRGLNRHEK